MYFLQTFPFKHFSHAAILPSQHKGKEHLSCRWGNPFVTVYRPLLMGLSFLSFNFPRIISAINCWTMKGHKGNGVGSEGSAERKKSISWFLGGELWEAEWIFRWYLLAVMILLFPQQQCNHSSGTFSPRYCHLKCPISCSNDENVISWLV